MCKRLEQIAAEKIRAFFIEYAPYEADEIVEDWVEALEENPEQVMGWVELYDTDIGQTHELYDVYNEMFDAVYEVCLCSE